VTNLATGSIGASGSSGLGVLITGGIGSVTNSGSTVGVDLAAGGRVINFGTVAGRRGVDARYTPGYSKSYYYAGKIHYYYIGPRFYPGGAGGAGIVLGGSASVINHGLIAGGASGAGSPGYAGTLGIDLATGTVNNFGTVMGGRGGDSLTFGATGAAGGGGIRFANAGVVINSGLIAGGDGGEGAFDHTMPASGFNLPGGTGGIGIAFAAAASIANSGLIKGGAGGGDSSSGGIGIAFAAAASIANSGLIEGGVGRGGGYSESGGTPGGNGGSGIDLGAAGILTNSGTIFGGSGGSGGSALGRGPDGVGGIGVRAAGIATITNYGLIQGGGLGGAAIVLEAGGLVSNAAGTIIGGAGRYPGGAGGAGIDASGGVAIRNTGTIEGGLGGAGGTYGPAGSSGNGITLEAGGSVTNGSASVRSALIQGGVGVYAASGAAATVTNFGTIEGERSVKFASAQDRLIAESGAQFIGAIEGGGGTFELAGGSGTISGLGGAGLVSGTDSATFSGFGSYVLDSGDHWTIVGTNVIGANQSLTNMGGLNIHGSLSNQAGGIIAGTKGNLIIDLGAAKVANDGLIEAAGSALVKIESAVSNGGELEAAGGTMIVGGAVNGSGKAVIEAGVLEFDSTFTQNVSFTGLGVLALAHSQDYAGLVSGFSASGGTVFDLRDIAFVASNEATFSGGVLTVSDGTHAAHIKLSGDFSGTTFTASSDGHGGTFVAPGKIYSGTYSNGITLTNFALDNPITVTGLIDAASGDGLGGSVDAWTIANTGSIAAPRYGVFLRAGGSVSNSGAIAGGRHGVMILGGVGSVSNTGSISGLARGVCIEEGRVRNSGSIGGQTYGVFASGGHTTVTNSGSITGRDAVRLQGGGLVGNAAGAAIAGTRYGAFLLAGGSVGNSGSISGAVTGVIVYGAAGRVTNRGSIAGSDSAVRLVAGGSVTNLAGASIGSGASRAGVLIRGGAGNVTNAGSILGRTAVWEQSGGSVLNQQGGVIAGSLIGVEIEGGSGSVGNSGSIGGQTYGVLASGGHTTVINSGSITGRDAVRLQGGGLVTNAAGAAIAGTRYGAFLLAGGSVGNSGSISGAVTGIIVYGAAGRVTNGGSIAGSDSGLRLVAGGIVTNLAGASIGSGASRAGVLIRGGAGNVSNAGSILGRTAVWEQSGGSVLNQQGGVITGSLIGVEIADGGSVDNAGAISGTGGVGVYAASGHAATVTNFGTIEGERSVKFAFAQDRLIAESGAQFIGAIEGGGGTFEVAGGSGTISGLGGVGLVSGTDSGTFSGFGSYAIDAGGNWTLAGSNVIGVGQSLIDQGEMTIGGSLVNNSAGTVTAAGQGNLTIDLGAAPLANAGVIEVTDTAAVKIKSTVANNGVLETDGGTMVVSGAVGGSLGHAVIARGTLEFDSTFSQDVSFSGGTGLLVLAKSRAYTGQVSGFSTTGGTLIDLRDIPFVSPDQASFSSGVLTVSDGTHVAHIKLAGDFSGSSFIASSDGHGGTLVGTPGKICSGTYTNGIVLTDFALNNPVTVTGVIDAATGDGLTGSIYAWTIGNTGTIAAPHYGVVLGAGGSVGNSGSIGGGVTGVFVYGAAGRVTNGGSISGGDSAVRLVAGGSVTNLAGALIGSGASQAGVLIKGGVATVTNAGSILGRTAVLEQAGGSVLNQQGGVINGIVVGGGAGSVENQQGGAITSVLIHGGTSGSVGNSGSIGSVEMYNTAGSVTNSGSIAEIDMVTGGNVTNDTGGSISSVSASAALTVSNKGLISGVEGQNSGVDLAAGGHVVNFGTVAGGRGVDARYYPGYKRTGYYYGGKKYYYYTRPRFTPGSGGGAGIVLGGSASVINHGLIAGGAGGNGSGFNFYIVAGGYAGALGIDLLATGTVSNFGTVVGGSGGSPSGAPGGGIRLAKAGAVTNSGLIAGGAGGGGAGAIHMKTGPGDGYAGALGIDLLATGTVSNSGTVVGGRGGDGGPGYNSGGLAGAGGGGIRFAEAGDVTNSGLIAGGDGGFAGENSYYGSRYTGGAGGIGIAFAAAASITNSGLIEGGAGAGGVSGAGPGGNGGNGGSGVDLGAAGTIFNSGLIRGGAGGGGAADFSPGAGGGGGAGIDASGGVGIRNTGTIEGGLGGAGGAYSGTTPPTYAPAGSSGNGITLEAGGSVTNGSASVSSALIQGGVGVYAASGVAATVTNFGTITGTSGTAVGFGGGADLLVVELGAVFNGSVQGGAGTDTVQFAAPGTKDVTNFSGFEDYQLANGGANALTLAAANFAGVTGSTITVTDGNSGNTVDASAAQAADTLVLHAGAGADKVTGGPGKNVYDFNNSTGASLDISNGFVGGAAPHGELDFPTGLTNQNLWLVKSNGNLVVEVIGTKEKATVDAWFGANPSAQLAEIAAGGLKLDSQVAQLVSAMATFSAAHPGFNPTAPGAVMPNDPTLQSALAAAWHS
jgi:hypothetical protein